MLIPRKILSELYENIDTIIAQTAEGKKKWELLIQQHPADIATLFSRVSQKKQPLIFQLLPESLACKVFEKMHGEQRIALLLKFDDKLAAKILQHMHSDELTDIFEHLSDKQLKKYLKLLQNHQREIVRAHFNFPPKSAGRIMNSDVLSLNEDFTIKKSINLLQRLRPGKDILRRIFITGKENILTGTITIDQLLINNPETLLKKIMEKPALTINVDERQEIVAQKMQHYDLSSAPVVDLKGHFLGAITADELFEVLEEEASEDLYRFSGVSPLDNSYFQTPSWLFIQQRFIWLAGLLILQSASSFIVEYFQGTIQRNVIISFFITMLIGTGGNAGNQSATLVIRGLATGEIKRDHAFSVLTREFWIGTVIALALAVISFLRVYITYHDSVSALAISLSLFLIVIMSIIMGSLIPLVLEWFDIDPAHSAAPFLTTLMDIFGILIYCLVCSKILG